MPCDIDVDFQLCPAARLGNICTMSLNLDTGANPTLKLAEDQNNIDNCNNYLDQQGFVCANRPEPRVLDDYNCLTLPPM